MKKLIFLVVAVLFISTTTYANYISIDTVSLDTENPDIESLKANKSQINTNYVVQKRIANLMGVDVKEVEMLHYKSFSKDYGKWRFEINSYYKGNPTYYKGNIILASARDKPVFETLVHWT